MSGPPLFGEPRHLRRGAALTMVFGALLATGTAANSWGDTTRPGSFGPAVPAYADAEQIAAAIDAGKVGPEAAEELVSRSGDRWSSFYTAEEYEGFEQALDGRYVGVGLWVRRVGGGHTEIARVQPGSPAERGGVRAGDRLRTIDGEPTDDRPVTEVVAALRGDDTPGTAVDLGLGRSDRTWRATLCRTVLATETVSVQRLGRGVTSVKIESFTKGVGDRVRDAARDSKHGVLLDLRGNSGGLVAEAVAVASVFLDGGLVATYDVHGEQRSLFATDSGGDTGTGTPVVVLVDGGTMSAAELLAGALQDRGRAVVVGSNTFGKGSVQMPSRLADGSVAELTVGHYRLPGGRDVDERGVEPDLAVSGGQDAQKRAREVLSGLGTHP